MSDQTRQPGIRKAFPLIAFLMMCLLIQWGVAHAASDTPIGHLGRAKVFLEAADYRHALEACQQQIATAPSAASYVYLTYVYHAIAGYVDHLAKTDQWKDVEQLYLNLAARETEDLIDPPGGLARMAMEIIRTSVRRQAVATAAMATRLDPEETERLWHQQAQWRTAHPDDWWATVPDAWKW